MLHKAKLDAERQRELKNGEVDGDDYALHGDQIMAEAEAAEDEMDADI
jgi:DNA excision repair protein ERCC-2